MALFAHLLFIHVEGERGPGTHLVSFPGSENYAFGLHSTIHLHHQDDLSAIRKGESSRPCGPLLVSTWLEPSAEMPIFDSVAVAGPTPGNIGQDQPNPGLLRTWYPNGCSGMPFGEDGKLELEIGVLVGSPDLEVVGIHAEAEITHQRCLCEPFRIGALG
jgi:hypothetical protein